MRFSMKIATICTLQLYGIFFILLGAVAILGYIFHIPWLTNFGEETAMSIPSSIGFITVGISHFIIADRLGDRIRNPWGSRNY